MDGLIIGFLSAILAFGLGVLIGISKWFDKLMKDIGDNLHD